METLMDNIPVLGSDPKKWVVAIAGLLAALIIGRFVQAFRSGAGLIDAGKAVLFGTNIPKPTTTPTNPNNPDRVV